MKTEWKKQLETAHLGKLTHMLILFTWLMEWTENEVQW